MEKRRRAKINQYLSELKTLILEAMKKDVSIFSSVHFISPSFPKMVYFSDTEKSNFQCQQRQTLKTIKVTKQVVYKVVHIFNCSHQDTRNWRRPTFWKWQLDICTKFRGNKSHVSPNILLVFPLENFLSRRIVIMWYFPYRDASRTLTCQYYKKGDFPIPKA